MPENADLKAAILTQVAGIVSEGALIASNTSSIPIAQLAAGVRRPERVLGLHFFSPVPVMKLVEVVVALDTSEETVAAAREFAERIGKRPIETKDRSGFIVNMLLVPYLMAAVRMYEEGFATPRVDRRGHGARLRAPDGPADALATSSASTSSTRSATRCMRSSSAPSTRRRRCSSGWSPRAGSAARPGGASTSTDRARRE